MLSFLIYLGWENSLEVQDGQVWTNLGVEAIRCLFSQQLAHGSALCRSRSRCVSAVSLNEGKAGYAN
jgi:hypothetical protein